MPYPNHTPEEVAARGERIYEQQIRERVGPADRGKFVTVDIETGNYEIDRSDLAATKRALAKRPEAIHVRITDRLPDRPPYRSPIHRRAASKTGVITGVITIARKAVIGLEILGSGDERQEVEAVIDTGFTGFLTLPGHEIVALELPLVGNQSVTLADGSRIVMDMYLARVPWHESQEHEVVVLQAEGGPLVGMELLYGNRVALDVVESGEATINALP